MRRFRRLPRALLIITIILTLCAFYPILQLLSLTSYGDPYNADTPVCQVGERVRQELVALSKETTGILSRNNVTHFLCYGSLWAHLRRGNLFPWDRTLSLGAFAEDVDRLPDDHLANLFTAKDLLLSYDRANGVYTVRGIKYGQRVSSPSFLIPELRLYTWKLNEAIKVNGDREAMRQRVGWRHRILPPGSEGLEEFPAKLVALPLPSVTLSGIKVDVSHEGAELQKYHYQDNWWTEVRPPGCAKI